LKKGYELRCLILAGLFAAFAIVCVRLLPVYFLPPGTWLVRVDLQFLMFAMAGWIIGPGWALGAAMVSDVAGAMINPTGAGVFFPGYALTAGLSGLMYGLILHKRSGSFLRVCVAAAAHMLFVALPLNALWATMIMKDSYPEFWPALWLSLPWRAALVLPYSVLIFGMQKLLNRAVAKL
jgi:ECF transporter S component (folate family)